MRIRRKYTIQAVLTPSNWIFKRQTNDIAAANKVFRYSIIAIFTGRNEVVAKVIFLHLSVIHSVHRGGLPQCMLGYHTPPGPGRPPPRTRQTTPPRPGRPQPPPDQADPPPRLQAYGLRAAGMHPRNAFLYCNLFPFVT